MTKVLQFRVGFVGSAAFSPRPCAAPHTLRARTKKEEEMKKTLTMIFIAMFAMLITACGGDEPAGNGAAELPSAGPAQETSTAPRAPLPTSPQRLDLDALLTPQPTNTREPQDPANAMDNAGTREPDNSARNNSPDAGNSSTNDPAPGVAGSNSTNPESTGEDITDLIPADAETNDRVLLQDIYARMDLSEFALDPRSPVPFREVVESHNTSGSWIYPEEIESIGFELNFADAEENPYLHVFPLLDTALRHREFGTLSGEQSAFLHPNKQTGGYDYTRFASLDPVTYFIYHPWFEPIQSKYDDGQFFIDNNHMANIKKLNIVGNYAITNSQSFGVHWFGRNSTRGVLSDAVAEALEQGLYPNAKPHPLKWYTGTRYNLEERDWDLDDYLRTTIGPPSRIIDSIKYYSLKFDTRNLKALAEAYPNGSVYQTPWTTWEILHPQLPIVRVTSHQETILPLAFQDPPPKPTLTFNQENMKHRYGRIPIDRTKSDYLKNTRFSVSFTIAFQHRWTSFQDPNRRIVRFEKMYSPSRSTNTEKKEANQISNGTRGLIVREKHKNFPNYWHSSDYMQHSIIGPVVVQVHESEVIEPGIYSVTPGVTSWEAPGPIALDKQVTAIKNRNTPNSGRILPFTYNPTRPNVNWPLPGHVMTSQRTQPGTKIWEKDMETYGDYDW